jgi:prepilin-type N-terminal cleavage/methylation domain-containing protein
MVSRITGRLASDDGFGLIETMVAILILGIVLTAMASTMISSMIAVSRNEHLTRATQLGNEALEELQSLDWDRVGLYTSDVATAPQFGGTTQFEGEDVVVIPDESPVDPVVPQATETVTRDGDAFELQRAITWTNAGVGAGDYKGFVVTLAWTDRGTPGELRVAGTRAPAPTEAVPVFGATLSVDQTTVAYDATGTSATPSTLTFTAVADPAADAFPSLTWEDAAGVEQSMSPPMTSLDGGVTWTTTVDTGTLGLPAGSVVVTFRATRGLAVAEASVTLAVTYDGIPPTVAVRGLALSQGTKTPICVLTSGSKAGQPKPPSDLAITADIEGLGSSDQGYVGVGWTGESRIFDMTWVADNPGGSFFELVVSNEGKFPLPAGSDVTFSIYRRASLSEAFDAEDLLWTDPRTPPYTTKGGSC